MPVFERKKGLFKDFGDFNGKFFPDINDEN